MSEEKQVSLEDVVKMLQSLGETQQETNAKIDNLSEKHYELVGSVVAGMVEGRVSVGAAIASISLKTH